MIREMKDSDLDGLMFLYQQLHDTHVYKGLPHEEPELKRLWERLLADENYHIIVADEEGKIVSTCTCIIIPNLTHEQRSYALVENVVTDRAFRGRGFATACLDLARDIAIADGCYRIFLLTGSKNEKTLELYEHAGYSRYTKTAFQQELP